MKVILAIMMMIPAANAAAKIDIPPDIEPLAKEYSGCLAHAYDVEKELNAKHGQSVAAAKRNCKAYRRLIVQAFPESQRDEVNKHIEQMVVGGFEARRRYQARGE